MWDWKAVSDPGGGSWRTGPSHSGGPRLFMTHPPTSPSLTPPRVPQRELYVGASKGSQEFKAQAMEANGLWYESKQVTTSLSLSFFLWEVGIKISPPHR